MKISFENADKVNGKLTMTVEAEDYKKAVEKKLREYRDKTSMPGFRPGHVPMGLIRRNYGAAVKVDEINKLLGEKLYAYVNENHIQMLGEPLPSETQVPQDLEGDGPFEFVFDIAIAPEFSITLDSSDTVRYCDVIVEDERVDSQVQAYASRNGHYEKVEEYDEEKRDLLKGDIRQLDADGNTLEGGITVSDAVLMPKYMKDEAQKALFDGAKLGDIITFNPKKAYSDSDTEVAALLKLKKEEVADITCDFSYQITEISRFVFAPVDQELFDSVFEPGTVTTEEDFRARIADMLKAQLTVESDFQFLADVRKYAEDKVGELNFPVEALKRMMKNNNKDKDASYVDEHFDASIRELKWHLIKEQLALANNLQVNDAEVMAAAKEMARAQYAQYGMSDVPDEYLADYGKKLLEDKNTRDSIVDRTIDRLLVKALKTVVKLDVKQMTLEELRALANE